MLHITLHSPAEFVCVIQGPTGTSGGQHATSEVTATAEVTAAVSPARGFTEGQPLPPVVNMDIAGLSSVSMIRDKCMLNR